MAGLGLGRSLRRERRTVSGNTIALAALAFVAVALFGASRVFASDFVGVASCAGSTCHGRSEGDGKIVRQDELRIWQDPSSKSGAHSRAAAVLSSPRGQRIATALGLGNAASASACLGCHATGVTGGVTRGVTGGGRGARFRVSDGVGCESCHGAAAGWISSHYAMPATHSGNLAAGMIALDRPQVRARVCLDCHYGSDKPGQFVTHAMMAAGHPRLSFELDLFSSFQAHYDLDADYAARKGGVDSVQLWAVGQAEAVGRATRLFSQPALAGEGLFPQFTFFDCHSCHRRISDQPSATRTFETNPARPIPFGNPPFNDENMIMLSAVSSTLAPRQAARFDAAATAFHAAMAHGRAPAASAAQALSQSAMDLSDALAARGHGADTAFAVIDAIAGKAISPRFTDYAGSAQAVMAIDTLLNALVREGRVTVGAAASIRAQINRAYDAVAAPERYDPPAFRAALASASHAIGVLR